MKVEDGKDISTFEYYPDGQLAERHIKDFDVSGATATENVESFVWDGLALIKRDKVDYTIEPHANGGNPIIADGKVLFNDLLGSSLGSVEDGKFTETSRTSFGESFSSESSTSSDFFTGKPNIPGLGYTYLFRNYRADVGKWQTSDPLGYPDGWNNLAYCNNWVTGAIDIRGDHVYHVLASKAVEGCGHSGAIVGDPTYGYHIMNYGGGNTDPDVVHSWSNKYTSLADALRALNKGRGDEPFDRIQKFEATPAQDDYAYGAMLDFADPELYVTGFHDCWDAVSAGLTAASITHHDVPMTTPQQMFFKNLIYAEELDFNKVMKGLAE